MVIVSFSDISTVACGTMSLELNFFKAEKRLDALHIFYATPGLHQDIPEIERQLVRQVSKAKEKTAGVVVVYGGKFCYVNPDRPTRLMSTTIGEQGPGVARINATHCMDMMAGEEDRNRLAQEVAGGEAVWWMTPGWIKYRKEVFKGWDKALANENFPIVAIFVAQLAFFGLRRSQFDDEAFLNVRRAFFAKASVALKQAAGFAQCFLGGVPTDTLHGSIPGGYTAFHVHGEGAVCHRIDDLIGKADVPDCMSFSVHIRAVFCDLIW